MDLLDTSLSQEERRLVNIQASIDARYKRISKTFELLLENAPSKIAENAIQAIVPTDRIEQLFLKDIKKSLVVCAVAGGVLRFLFTR
jgi:hypothetical protein